MKILCIASLYNRPSVSEVFITGMKRLGIELLVCISEPDSLELCRRLNIPFIKHNNLPVGHKMNTLLRSAMDFNWTHLMISGDDDIYIQEILGLYEQYQHEPAVGFTSVYFIHPSSNRALKFSYTTRETTVGAGRLISRNVIEAVLNKCGGLWDGSRSRSLDASMDMRLAAVGAVPKRLELQYPYAIDIKTNQNIWSFDSLVKFTKNGSRLEEVSYKGVLTLIPEEERILISRITS